jgi:hypothetical protein
MRAQTGVRGQLTNLLINDQQLKKLPDSILENLS